MVKVFAAALAALCLAACGGPDDAAARPAAVRVFEGATVYTTWDAEPRPLSVAVGEEGRVAWVGPAADLASSVNVRRAERIDVSGAILYPGFTDSHAHLLGVGQRELNLDLSDVESLGALVERVAAEVDGRPDGATITGRGWIETDWPEGRMPTAADLDAVAPDNPVLLTRADGHALVANGAALEAVGVDALTPDPDGGRIERDEDGLPTGLLIDNAMALVGDLVTEPSEAQLERAYATGAALYVSRGWTGMHNMSVDPDHAPIIERLSRSGDLPLRLYNAFNEEGFDIAANRLYETPLVTNRAVKIYMDGALGSRGALLAKPYSDQPDTVGLSLRGRGETQSLMLTAHGQNVQLAIHAIGDLANRRALTWIEDIFSAFATWPDHRWRIEHAQIVAPQDLGRFADLGVVASMQPSHAIGDLKFASARLGPDRLDGAYAWTSLIDSGAVVAAGSDAPVEVGSPLIEFYAAVARKDLSGASGPDWRPDEAVSRPEALRMLTAWPAYASFQDNQLGAVEAGAIADFTLFDRDLMTVPEAEILEANAVMTVIGGRVAWPAE